jgi:hypothetical protein
LEKRRAEEGKMCAAQGRASSRMHGHNTQTT